MSCEFTGVEFIFEDMHGNRKYYLSDSCRMVCEQGLHYYAIRAKGGIIRLSVAYWDLVSVQFILNGKVAT